MMLWLTVPVGVLLGFFLPGYVVARKLCAAARVETAFVLSCLILFLVFFSFNAAGVRLRFLPVGGALVAVTVVLHFALRRVRVGPPAATPAPAFTWPMVAMIAAVVLLFAWRAGVSPLTGYDTPFRWDRLAVQIAGLGHFRFLPPRSDYDYRHYFYCDSVPPLVPICYAWLYVSAGFHLPVLTAIVVTAQYVAAIAFTARAGAAILGSPRGGALAGLLLAGCPMVFGWTAIGQETGMFVLSTAAVLYFLAVAAGSERRAVAPVLLAGASAAVAALSREYGPAFVGLALVACAGLRVGWRRGAAFVGVAVVLSAPWYVRTYLLTGNPVYSNHFFDFPVNPVLNAMLAVCAMMFSPRTWSAGNWAGVFGTMLLGAPVVLPAGLVGGLIGWRRRGYLLVIAVAVVGLFLWSVSHTAGGKDYAMRVATPAMVPLAVLAATVLVRVPQGMAVAMAAAAFTLIWCWPFPDSPARLRRAPGQSVADAYFESGLHVVSPSSVYPEVLAGIRERVPRGGVVLTDNLYLPQALDPVGIKTVPPWRPDMAFLFDGSVPSVEEAFRRLRAAGVTHIAYQPSEWSGRYMSRFEPFKPAAGRAVWLTRRDLLIVVPG